MGSMKTPGVYIIAKNAFPNSVVEAPTAIPAFIGYTKQAVNGNNDLKNVPWKISSMTEYIQYFGGGPDLKFEVDIKDGSLCIEEKNSYTLYYNMMLFFANGGSTCYIVSVGSYEDALNKNAMLAGLEKLTLEQEITLVVIPEAVNLKSNEEFKDIQQQMLSHCGNKMKNRFALLDIYPKADENTKIEDRVTIFCTNIGSNFLSYGAAYFPWLNTSVVGERDLTGDVFVWTDNVYTCRTQINDDFAKIVESLFKETEELEIESSVVKNNHTFKLEELAEGNIYADNDTKKTKAIGRIESIKDIKDTEGKKVIGKSVKVIWLFPNNVNKQAFHQALYNGSSVYKQAIKGVLKKLNLLPPSAAMAGIYTMVDNSRGVWKAPANVTLSYVDSLVEDIDDDQQADLNAPAHGKAVNVIRLFRGEGIKVWGARTLDGNSLDWRYVNVRRTLLFLEESIKNAARTYVFEPNDAGTWINMKCMIENFLRSVWKRGGLAGATPEDAFEVHIGLGDTMTAEDILNGIMRITVLVAVTHPAEFIEITFQQQAQKS